MIATLELPPVTKYQADAIFCPERNAVIEATTKAGKTYGCILWIIHEAINCPTLGWECWWVAPVFPQSEIAFRRLKDLLASVDPDRRFWSANETKLSVQIVNAACIRFKSADHPDTLYGEDVWAAVIDEACRCKEPAWHAVRSTLTATKGKVRIIGNVKGRNTWAYKLARKAESGWNGWRYAKITAADAVAAGVLDSEEIEAARESLPEHVFRELYYAEPSDDGGNPFGLQHIQACAGRDIDLGRTPVAFGVDLARKQDWLVVAGLDADHQVCRFDRWQHIPWEESYRRIAAMIGDTPTLVDSTGLGDVVLDRLQRMCPAVEGYLFSPQGKQKLMEGLSVAIQSHRIGFPDGPIRTELDCFEFEVTRTYTRYSAPEGMSDDCVCALALAEERAATFVDASASVIVGRAGDPVPVPCPQCDRIMKQTATGPVCGYCKAETIGEAQQRRLREWMMEVA